MKLPIRGAFDDFTTRNSDHLGAILDRKELPPRGAYRLFRMGRTTLTTDCSFRCGLGRWWDFKADLGRAWEFGSRNRCEVWISLKFEGPAFYPEDEGKANQLYCDRVVVVRDEDK